MLQNLAALRREARDLHFTVSPEASAKAAKLAAMVDDAMLRTKRQIGEIVSAIGSAVAPLFLRLQNVIKPVLVGVLDFIRANKNLFATISLVATAVAAAGTALIVAGGVLTALGTAAGFAAGAIGVVGSILGAVVSPIGLIAGALLGGAAAWLMWTDSGQQAVTAFQSLFGDLWDTFSTTFGGIKDALSGGEFMLAANIAIAGLELAFNQGFETLNNLTGGTLEWIRNAFLSAFGAISFAANNWKLLLKIAAVSAGLAIVTFANQTIHFFTVAIPAYLQWFYNNWRDVFTDIVNITKTVASNIWTNLKNLWDGIVSLFNGEGFKFEWTPLTEGFKSAIKELPKVAEREMGRIEKSLRDQLAGLGDELKQRWQEDLAGREPILTPEQRTQASNDKLAGLTAKAHDAAAKADELQHKGKHAAAPEEIAAKDAKVTGTFSTVAASMFGKGGDAVERTANNTAKIAKEQAKTNKYLAGLGFSFASNE